MGLAFFGVILSGLLPEGASGGFGNILAFAFLVAVAAIAGHVAQRTVLRWPQD